MNIADDLLAPAMLENPFPALAVLRSGDPVHWNPLHRAWMLTRHDDVRDALRDVSTFASNDRADWGLLAERLADSGGVCARRWLPLATQVLVGQDPPVHPRLRTLVSKALTPRLMKSLESSIECHAEALARGLQSKPEFDLASQFAEPLSRYVLLDLLAIPREHLDLMRAWGQAHRRFVAALLAGDARSLQEAAAILETEKEWLGRLIAERRRSPRQDFASALVHVEHHGDALSDEEVFLILHFFLLVAGHETTASLIAIGMLELLRHPSQWRRLAGEPALIPSAVRELMRYVSPALLLRRIVRRGTRLRGRSLNPGESVYLMIGAANRDPHVFPEPEALDIGRDNSQSLALGVGPHSCIGGLLAQMETETAVSTLMRHLPRLALGAGRFEFEPSCVVRKCRSVPVKTG